MSLLHLIFIPAAMLVGALIGAVMVMDKGGDSNDNT